MVPAQRTLGAIDAALKTCERTRSRRPILDLLAQAWGEGHFAGYGEAVYDDGGDASEPKTNPYEED